MKTKIPIGLKRLQELSKKARKIKPENFYFKAYIKRNTACGTVGCLIGHCPKLFPKHWTFKKLPGSGWPIPIVPCLKSVKPDLFVCPAKKSGMKFFELIEPEYFHLFIPFNQCFEMGDATLNNNTTPIQAADSIDEFVKRKLALLKL